MENRLPEVRQENVFGKLFRRKSADDAISESKKNGLKRTLTAFDLTILGLGAIIGSGIFTLSGTATAGSEGHLGAGPGFILSLVLAALACAFAALCYAEFAAMIPVAGSAYAYTFATLGELAAWLIGWILMLEYAIGNITVASGWSGYLFQLLGGFKGILPDWLINPPYWLIYDAHTAALKYKALGLDPATQIPHLFGMIPFSINLPAIFIIAVVTVFLYIGIQESAKMTRLMVIIKLAVIFMFIGVGAFYIKPGNWTPFLPNGFDGVFTGAFLIFFAYIGFDAVSTAAEETINPQKNIPIGIIASLSICTLVYILVAAVLTGMVPWNTIDTHAPVAAAMKAVGSNWANITAGLISLGAVTGLASVLLVLQLGTTRILFAMSRDSLLPGIFSRLHPKFQTPHVVTILSGIFVAIGTLVLDLNAAAELCNIGTLSAFLIVCVGVIILRYTDPDRERPFKVPFMPIPPILGIITCLGLIIKGVPARTLHLFAFWLIIGLIIYFSYGFRKNRDENSDSGELQEQPQLELTE